MNKSFKLWFIVIILGVFLILGGVTALASTTYVNLGYSEDVVAGTYDYDGANIIALKQANMMVIWTDGTVPGSNTDIINIVKSFDNSDNSWTDGAFVTTSTLFNFNDFINPDQNHYNVPVTINTTDKEFTIGNEGISHYYLIGREEFGSFKLTKIVNGDNAPTGTVFDFTVAFSSASSLDDVEFSGDYEDIIESTITPGTYAVKLLAGGYAIFTNIPLNNTSYSVTEDTSGLSSYWTGPEDAYTGSITGTTQVAVEVENSYDGPDYGSLVVVKNVTGSNADPDQAFEITVVFALPQVTVASVSPISLDDIQYSSDVDEDDLDLTENPDGTYTFFLKDGESVRFYNIPMGVSYTATEEDSSNWPTGWSGPTNDEEDLAGTIDSTTEQTVTLDNTYTHQDGPEYGSLRVIKVVEEGASTTEEFDIRVTFTLGQNNMTSDLELIDYNEEDLDIEDVLWAGNTVTFYLSLADDEYVDFSNIPMGVSYSVTEVLTDDQEAAGWDGPNSAATGSIETTTRQTVTIYNEISGGGGGDDPKYGSLKVIKNVSGDGASDTERFDITVTFEGSTSNLNKINFSDGNTESDGVYEISLSDDEYVIFSNIPMGVSYTVSEALTDDEEAAGWTGPDNDATGRIRGTSQQLVTVENTYEQGGVLGEKEVAEEEEESGVLGVSEKIDPELPKTGGVSTTMQLLLIGLVLVAIGTAVGLKKKHDAQ